MSEVRPTRTSGPPRPHHPRRWGGVAGAALGVLLVLPVPVLAGCSGTSGSPDAASAIPTSGSYLADPSAVETLLADRFAGSPTMRRLTIWADAVAVEVRDPAKPENLDTYSYRDGEWTTSPVRVTLSDIEELDARVFTLADLDLSKVPGLIAMALEGLALEGETVTAVSYDRIAGERPRVYFGIDGLRGSGSLMANADGSDPRIRRN